MMTVPRPTGIIGFTGRQTLPTRAQIDTLLFVLAEVTELHHGDCIGADAEAHCIMVGMAERIGARFPVLHPPDNPVKRAYSAPFSEVRPPKPYLIRNHDIVDETRGLIAVPSTDEEQLRSGTWATVRYARTLGRPIWIIVPNGRIGMERCDG
jgi:hypothetical protein